MKNLKIGNDKSLEPSELKNSKCVAWSVRTKKFINISRYCLTNIKVKNKKN